MWALAKNVHANHLDRTCIWILLESLPSAKDYEHYLFETDPNNEKDFTNKLMQSRYLSLQNLSLLSCPIGRIATETRELRRSDQVMPELCK